MIIFFLGKKTAVRVRPTRRNYKPGIDCSGFSKHFYGSKGAFYDGVDTAVIVGRGRIPKIDIIPCIAA